MREGELGRKEENKGGENTAAHKERDTQAESRRFGLACEPPFFLQFEVYRSVTDNRELRRWFIRGPRRAGAGGGRGGGQSLLSQGPSKCRIYRI